MSIKVSVDRDKSNDLKPYNVGFLSMEGKLLNEDSISLQILEMIGGITELIVEVSDLKEVTGEGALAWEVFAFSYLEGVRLIYLPGLLTDHLYKRFGLNMCRHRHSIFLGR